MRAARIELTSLGLEPRIMIHYNMSSDGHERILTPESPAHKTGALNRLCYMPTIGMKRISLPTSGTSDQRSNTELHTSKTLPTRFALVPSG